MPQKGLNNFSKPPNPATATEVTAPHEKDPPRTTAARCCISQNKIAVFRDPAIRSFLILFAILWLHSIVLIDIYT